MTVVDHEMGMSGIKKLTIWAAMEEEEGRTQEAAEARFDAILAAHDAQVVKAAMEAMATRIDEGFQQLPEWRRAHVNGPVSREYFDGAVATAADICRVLRGEIEL